MLQLLKNLRSRSQGKETTDADIFNWANNEVNQKMILILTASIMYWSLQQQTDECESTTPTEEVGILETAVSGEISNLAMCESTSDPTLDPTVSPQVDSEEPSPVSK